MISKASCNVNKKSSKINLELSKDLSEVFNMYLHKGYFAGRKDNPKAPALKAGELPHSLDEIQSLKPQSIVAMLADNIIMIDCDNQKDVIAMDNVLNKLRLSVPTMITTRGKHYYFSNLDTDCKCLSAVRLACGIKADIKNGKVSSFDCIMTDGVFRKWINGDAPLSPLPKALTPLSTKLDTYSGMVQGSRNQTLMNELGVLKRFGFSYSESRFTLNLMNTCVFAQPIPQNEFDHVTREKLYTNAYNRKHKAKSEVGNNFDKDLIDIDLDDGDESAGDTSSKKKKFDHEGIAKALIENLTIINLDGMLMAFDDGVYKTLDKNELERVITFNVADTTIRQRNEVCASIRNLAPVKTFADAANFLDYFAFKNGIFKFDLKTQSFIKVDVDPNILIFNRIPHNYNPNARSLYLDQFMNDIACGRDDIKIQLYELLGHCLMRRNNVRGIFILLGETSNGKSTFLNLLSAMLGRDNVSALKMHELSDRFNKWQIGYKLANIGDDLSDDYLADSNFIKSVSTSDAITVERKGKDGYVINPYCSLVFSANTLPKLKDRSTATLNRITVIPFNAKFTPAHPNYDPDLAVKLNNTDVMEALITYAMYGLTRIKVNKQLTVTYDKVKIRTEYAELNDPVLSFIKDRYWSEEVPFMHMQISPCAQFMIGKTPMELHAEYKEFCLEESYKPLGKTKFVNAVCKYLTSLEVKRVTINGEKRTVFVNTDTVFGALNLPSSVM